MEAKPANPRILLAATFLLKSLLLLGFLPKTLLSWLFTLSSRIISPPSSPTAVPSATVSSSSEAMDTAELRRVFGMFDRNGDGRITRRELSESLESLGMFVSEKELEGMIEKIDVDRDGCVDVGEFRELYREIMEEREGAEEDMREAFGVFDADGDGYITVEELRAVLASLGLKQGRTVEECERMIGKVDSDGDGVVDFQEFKQMMRGGGLAALSH